MNRRSIIVSLCSVLFAGCASRRQRTGDVPVKVVESSLYMKAGMYYIKGIVENQGDRTFEFTIVVTWYGRDGVVLGELFDSDTIDAGQKRAFSTTLYNPDDHGEPDHREMEVRVS